VEVLLHVRFTYTHIAIDKRILPLYACGAMPSLRSAFTNMSVPMPLHLKLRLLVRNNLIKIAKRQSCCGHPGEPGC
jgi:hypothetical protein